MRRSSWLVVVVLLGAVAAMVALVPGRDEVGTAVVSRSPLPASVGEGAASWYCAARDLGVEELSHRVAITSVSDRDTSLVLDAFGEEGRGGSAEVELGAGQSTVVDVGAVLGGATQSVMVEATAPVVVEHRMSTGDGAGQSACSTFSSDTWYFPVAVSTRDATARLSLFNPFPGDAAVDVEVAFETGVRIPQNLTGLVVESGTTRVVELGAEGIAERRDQFSVTVRARSGAIVAELGQHFDGSNDDRVIEGVRLVPGSREPARRWVFAGGFVDEAVSERIVVQNPRNEPVDVLVQVTPHGGLDTRPEPFELTVPPLRYALVDLDVESRVPAVGYHSIAVESLGGPVVVGRSLDVSESGGDADATPLRPLLEGGTTASVGALAAATDWVSTGLRRDDAADSAVVVQNPGTQSASVRVRAVDADTGEVGPAVEVEVPAGDATVVASAELAPPSATFAVRVGADVPVVVERLAVFRSVSDLSLATSVPDVAAVEDLRRLGVGG